MQKAVQDPEFRAVIDKAETEVAYLGAEGFTKFWERDSATLEQVIKRIGTIESK